jgi:hypothetical protein
MGELLQESHRAVRVARGSFQVPGPLYRLLPLLGILSIFLGFRAGEHELGLALSDSTQGLYQA